MQYDKFSLTRQKTIWLFLIKNIDSLCLMFDVRSLNNGFSSFMCDDSFFRWWKIIDSLYMTRECDKLNFSYAWEPWTLNIIRLDLEISVDAWWKFHAWHTTLTQVYTEHALNKSYFIQPEPSDSPNICANWIIHFHSSLSLAFSHLKIHIFSHVFLSIFLATSLKHRITHSCRQANAITTANRTECGKVQCVT